MIEASYLPVSRLVAPGILPVQLKNVCLCVNLDQCNLRCIMCWQTYSRESNRQVYQSSNLPREQLLQLLRSPGLEDATISVVGGGEPFLYPYMEDLLREAPTARRRLMIMTNGTLIQNHPVFWETAEHAPITLIFSIDAATPETYAMIRPPGLWPQLMANIERFREMRSRNPRLELKTSFVLLRQNMGELLDFMRMNAEWGSLYVHIHPAIRSSFPEEWRIDPYDPEYLGTIREVVEFARQNSISLDHPEDIVPPEYASMFSSGPQQPGASRPASHHFWQPDRHDPRRNCRVHTEDMTVSHLGDVYLCDTAFRVYYSCGNVFSQGIKNLWLSPAWLSIRLAHKLGVPHRHPLCSRCLMVIEENQMKPKTLIHHLRQYLYKFHPRRLARKLLARPGIFTEWYTPEEPGHVTLYADEPEFYPGFPVRRPIFAIKDLPRRQKVSLVTTVKDQAVFVDEWVKCVNTQNCPPDEIIVVDRGSSDATLERLRALAGICPLPLRVIQEEGASVARARNLGIAQASGAVIAVTDFDCRPPVYWLEYLLLPFNDNPGTQVSAGWYTPIDRWGNWLHARGWPHPFPPDPLAYLPSSRSLAFLKETWETVGGYPEWLDGQGLDMAFAMELKRGAPHWAFVPMAAVNWTGPDTTRSYWRNSYRVGLGDGVTGANAPAYWRAALKAGAVGAALAGLLVLCMLGLVLQSWLVLGLVLMLALAAAGLVLGRGWRVGLSTKGVIREQLRDVFRTLGFLQGVRQRPQVNQRKPLAGVFFILSGIEIDDTGGGARCTQLALEMLRNQYQVVFINKYPKYESVELDFRIYHPNLITSPLSSFSLQKYLDSYGSLVRQKPVGILIEFPLDDFLPIIQGLNALGAVTVYDLLDDWDSSLGAAWYTVEKEKQIVENSRELVATAPVLVERLKKLSGRPVSLQPNAANLRLFNPARSYTRPSDLPQAEWTMIYFGALWGDWFDWDLLVGAARRYPEANVFVIGDYRGQCPEKLPNLHFPGLKLQKTLPAYLAFSDVAVLPWKVSSITLATSPIKVFEFLAMRRPVVTPDLPLLYNTPFVLCSKDQEDFLSNLSVARQLQVEGEDLERFLHDNSWQARVEFLTGLLNKNKVQN
jgi:MoaA/NifB/PqqE/SkfB family radical SAM enzyme